ncbi:MAG: hypothetical protein M1820_000437 [Bogoriella megaspora]|nr:MAG: hypothetical protein M1820_000437 [Bogoriella megaspora]
MSQKAFQSELSAIEEGMPPLSGLEYWALQTEIMTTKCAIYEVSLYMSQAPPGHSMTRISSLWNLLKSAKELVSFCFRIPDDLISHLSTASISMFWYAFMILAKVVLVPTASGWDRDTAKKEADLAGLGRAAKNKLTSIKIKENADLDQSDVWTYFCHVMKSMLAWNKKQEMGDRGSATIETSTANAPQALEKPKGIPWPPTQTAPSQHIPDFDLFPDATAQSDTRVSEVQLTPDISDQAWDASPSQDFIDETLWQRVLDDFTLLPPAPMGGFPVSAFAPYNWPLSSGNGL